VLLLLLCLAVGPVLAKYIATSEQDIALHPTNFVFVSDYKDGHLNYVPASGETQTVTVTVSNYDLSYVTTKDITFSAVLSDGASSTPYGPYTLSGSVSSEKELSFDLAVGKKYTLSVTSSAPYTKTITHEFMVYRNETDHYYSISGHGSYLMLELYLAGEPCDITLHYADLAPDNTHEWMRHWLMDPGGNGEGVIPSTSMTPYSRYTLIFFGDALVSDVPITKITDGSVTVKP